MKTKELLILIITTLLLLNLTTLYAEDNLIRNSSFERLINEMLPSNWRTQSWVPDTTVAHFGVDVDNFYSGSYSVFINNGLENHSYYIQTVKVQENTFYKISGWIKTENVGAQSEGAGISLIDYFDVGGNLRGTNDWQFAELYVTTGPGVSSIEVMLQIGNYGSLNTGKAWFDDITMTKVDTIPANVAIAVVSNKKNSSQDASDKGSTKDVKKQKKNQGVFLFFLIAAIIVILAGAALIVAIIIMRKKSGQEGEDTSGGNEYNFLEEEKESTKGGKTFRKIEEEESKDSPDK
jgi:hypothetical protein